MMTHTLKGKVRRSLSSKAKH